MKFKLLSEEDQEKRFKERIEQLDLKKKQKLQNRRKKAQKLADFQQKHKLLFLLGRLSVIACVASSVYIVYSSFEELSNNYLNTKEWEKKSTIQLASLDVETLYASEGEKEIREYYLTKLNELWNNEEHRFVKQPNDQIIAELSTSYNEITTSKTSLQETYDEVMLMWSVKQKLDDLFINGSTSHRTLKKDSTMSKVSTTLNQVYDDISKFLIDSKYSLANEYYVEISNLSDDLSKLSSIIYTFDSKFDRAGSQNQLNIKTDMLQADFSQLKSSINSLSYEWEIVNQVIDPVLKNSEAIISLNEADTIAFNQYQLDETEKTEFFQFLDTYKKDLEKVKSQLVETKSYIDRQKSDVENELKQLDIYVQWKTEKTKNKSKDQIIFKQNLDTSKYKYIKKGSTITLTYYEYQDSSLIDDTFSRYYNDQRSSETSTFTPSTSSQSESNSRSIRGE